MRKRLFRNTLFIAAAVLALFGVTAAVAADIAYTRLMVSSLRQNTLLIAARIAGEEDLPALAEAASRALSSGGTETRVTLVGRDGAVLGDSSAEWREMEPHGDRPEIAQAFETGWGSSQRYSETLRVRMLYVAVCDDAAEIAVRAAMPLYAIQKIYWFFAAFLLLSLLLSLAVATLMARRASRLLSRPVTELMRMTDEITRGNYAPQPLQSGEPEFLALSAGLTQLAGSLDAHVSALQNSNTQLMTVLSSMGEGLIALDGEGGLQFINQRACALLGMDESADWTGRPAAECLPWRTAVELAAACIGDHAARTAELSPPETGLLLQLTATPMKPPALGCILLLVDITNLRKLENLRRDFVANVTHELRTPLTSIRGYVETLQAGALDDPALSARFLQIIEIESERLSNLIGDLLSLSEIESAREDTGIRAFRLDAVVRGVVEMLELAASARQVSLAFDVGEDIVLEANPDRIKQLLLNLADNAVKYNREGGRVHISAERTHGFARIRVSDTGIGIPEEHASRIFERFYRVDRGRSRSLGGTGLGLSIVKHIVDLYRGNIRLVSRPGQGSEFTVDLPLRHEPRKQAP